MTAMRYAVGEPWDVPPEIELPKLTPHQDSALPVSPASVEQLAQAYVNLSRGYREMRERALAAEKQLAELKAKLRELAG